MSDQDRISCHNIKMVSSRQVMRVKKSIIGWSNTKLSNLTSQELYGRQYVELLMRSWDLNGFK